MKKNPKNVLVIDLLVAIRPRRIVTFVILLCINTLYVCMYGAMPWNTVNILRILPCPPHGKSLCSSCSREILEHVNNRTFFYFYF